MLLRPELAHDRAEDARADRLRIVVDQHGRVRIEADGRAVGTMDVLGGPHDHGLVDVALLHAAPRRRFLDGDDDDVANAGKAPLGTAQHLDALDALGAAIVGDLKVGLHLDHRSNSFFILVPRRRPGSRFYLLTHWTPAFAGEQFRLRRLRRRAPRPRALRPELPPRPWPSSPSPAS